MDAERPIASIDELVAHFHAGEKPAAAARVGMEHEKIGVFADGRAVDYPTIRRLLEAMAARGWERTFEHEHLIALQRDTCGTITLEPGGQVEHSGAPWPSAVKAVQDNDKHMDELLPLAAELGVTFLGVGFRPFGTIDDVPWMPKGRYRVMRAYLPKRGAMAHEMMKRTATVQANFDYVDEADAMSKLRVGLSLSSLVTALFAASPLYDGRPSAYQSVRARAWLDTDPARCGLLPFAFHEGASFRDYAEWALDVPMFFVYRDGEYRALDQEGDVTFRRFWRDGAAGTRATAGDWELHLSTLFPEVRLKRYVEVRQADASTRAMVRALPCLWRGVLYDHDARAAAWALTATWSYDDRVALWRDTPARGLRATTRHGAILPLCRELVAIARAGLLRLGSTEGARLLEPLDEILATETTAADRIVAAYEGVGGDPHKLIPLLALR
jgi:glutamate--cysteine ligase